MMSDYAKRAFPPFTWNSALAHYLPMGGAVSHAAFGVHVFNPSILAHLFDTADWAVANAFFFNANLGVGLYLYQLKHMKKVEVKTKVLYSIYGAVLFNFGSVLFWATTKAILPTNRPIRAVFAVLTSFTLLAVGRQYLGYVDTLAVEEDIE